MSSVTDRLNRHRLKEANAKPKLNNQERSVINTLIPFRGETPVLPDKLNPSIPDNIWASLQNSGALAAMHLEMILSDKKFSLLSIKDKARMIDLALGRAYGSVDGAVRKNLHAFVNPEDDSSFNALSALSKKAHKTLPEFNPVSPVEGKLSDEDGGD